MSNPAKHFWTLEEYRAYEDITQIRHEYIDGEIFARTGHTFWHSSINVNAASEIALQTRQTKHRCFSSSLCIKISDTKYVYPDMSIVSENPHLADKEGTLLLNPSFVLEVFSPETENYDKGKKADYYMSLPSLQIYLLLEQERPHAILYTRHELGWLKREFSGIEATVPLEAIGCELKLSEAYLNVAFADGE